MARTDASVIIATRGRPLQAAAVLDRLAAQTHPPAAVAVVGAAAEDLAGLESHPLVTSSCAALLVAPRAGLTAQRNCGLDWVTAQGLIGARSGAVVVFFDDDFRPADDWLEECVAAFARWPSLAGLTGRVLADGVVKGGLSEIDAQAYLHGARPPDPHWLNRRMDGPVSCLYGCNMAIAGGIAVMLRFDEALPLYGWQEDQDYSGQLSRLGELRAESRCTGVHLGVRSGRVSGVRFGYSQIANPLRIVGRGNMTKTRACQLVCKALAANAIKSITSREVYDYPGRLRGNLTALSDVLQKKCDPMRVMAL